MECNPSLSEEDVEKAYNSLHESLWETHWARAKAVLLWSSQPPEFHSRILAGSRPPLPMYRGASSKTDAKAYLITDYKVVMDNGEHRLDIRNRRPYAEVDWPRKDGMIDSKLAAQLGLPSDTYVSTNTDPNHAYDMIALVWSFGDRERPNLLSGSGPLLAGFFIRSLLGIKVA